MDTLKETVHREVSGYVGRGANGYSYLVANPEQTDWTVVFVLTIDGQRVVRSGLIVRLWKESVLIEQDTNEPPLVDALVQAGVPRSRIILAYAGEPVPETV
jgi:hypothetical protein